MTTPIKIRKYQKECVEACMSLPIGGRGQVILPTGSGKTVIAQEVIKNRSAVIGIIAKAASMSNVPTATIIFVPRLMLSKQWIKTSAKRLLVDAKLKFAFINVNTGGVSNKVRETIEKSQYLISGVSRKLVSCVDSSEVSKEVANCRKDGYHVIVLCTYHSSVVAKESKVLFDLGIYDECQYLVSSSEQESEYRNSLSVAVQRRLFFTATPRYTFSDEGLGMNNSAEFGNIIFERKPIQIIDAGAIVGPKIHIVGCEKIIDGGDYNNRMDMIYKAWQYHKEEVKTTSVRPDEIGAKLLIVCDGQMVLQGVFDSRRFKEIRNERPDLRMYGLSTEFGLYIDNGKGDCDRYLPPVRNSLKEEFLLSLDSMQSNDDALIFHVDMIAEGLDVPGITGLLPLRHLGKVKFLQNLGRATRLHPVDASRIYETNELKVGDYANYIKSHCYVILQYCMDNREDFLERYANIIEEMRTEYGFDPSDSVITDILHPAQEGPDWDEDELKRQIRSRVIGDIQSYYSLQEEEHLELEETLNVHKIRRFTPQQMEEFIRLASRNKKDETSCTM